MTFICTSEPYVAPQRVGASDAWTQAGGMQELLGVEEATAPDWVTIALDLRPGAKAVYRTRLMHLDGRPFELVESWYPTEIAVGTPLANRRKIKGGAVTLLADLGYTAAEAVDDVLARPASPGETHVLELPQRREPVLELRRVSYTADGRPFAAESMVRVANAPQRYRLRVG